MNHVKLIQTVLSKTNTQSQSLSKSVAIFCHTWKRNMIRDRCQIQYNYNIYNYNNCSDPIYLSNMTKLMRDMFPFIFDLCIVLKTECSDFLRGSGNSQPFSSLPQNFTFQGQTQNCERENLIGQYSGKCFEMVPDYVWCNLLYFPILLRNCVFDKNVQLLLSLFLF